MLLRATHEPYEPTPEEIDRVCAEIRSRWSEHERRARSGGILDDDDEPPRWFPPEISLTQLPLGRAFGD